MHTASTLTRDIHYIVLSFSPEAASQLSISMKRLHYTGGTVTFCQTIHGLRHVRSNMSSPPHVPKLCNHCLTIFARRFFPSCRLPRPNYPDQRYPPILSNPFIAKCIFKYVSAPFPIMFNYCLTTFCTRPLPSLPANSLKSPSAESSDLDDIRPTWQC